MKTCRRGHQYDEGKSTCTECRRERQRGYSRNYRTNLPPGLLKEYKRNWEIKSKYKLTPEKWDAMFFAQGSCCAICKSENPQTKLGWHTDHCHVSGKVRGILCHHCNLMLGRAKDNIATLQAAVDYLK